MDIEYIKIIVMEANEMANNHRERTEQITLLESTTELYCTNNHLDPIDLAGFLINIAKSLLNLEQQKICSFNNIESYSFSVL